ncbi:hypothetical protein [Priestia aryabhattai]
MSKVKDTIELFQDGLKFWRDIKFLYQEGKSLKEIYQKMTSVEVDDRDQLIKGLKDRKISYGDFIKIDGILLSYAHLYRPSTYINALAYDESKASGNSNLIMAYAHRPFQLPISKIPALSKGKEEFCLSFLYPRSFSSFLYPAGEHGDSMLVSTSEEIGSRTIDPQFTIPNWAKPIPVIININDAVNYEFKRVQITAQVRLLPEELVRNLTGNDFSSMVFSDIISDTNVQTPSLCLDCTLNKSQIKKASHGVEYLRNCTASIFVEGELEGVTPELLPSLPQICTQALPIATNGSTSTGEFYQAVATKNDVQMIMRWPNFIGFYKECNIAQPGYFESQFNEVKKTIRGFNMNLKKVHPNLEYKINFLHDFRYKNRFQNDVLNSSLSKQVTEESLRETIDWLKGNSR